MIPNIFVEIFELNGLLYVALTALIAGIVRGFSGFGTAMIFLPVAGKYFDPVTAIIVLTIMDLCGPALIVPKALRDAYKPDLLRLIGGMIITLPLALYFLVNMETEIFRYIVSTLALFMVCVLAMGWRFHIHPVKVIRANNLLFLFGFDIFALFFLGVASVLNINAVFLGLVLAIPMGLANVIGAVLFNPEKEKLYRMIAFLIITLSALSGLPLLSDRLLS